MAFAISYMVYVLLIMYSCIFRYTHIQALLDLFIFQNPMKPVTHFEYYSEHLKMHYIQLQTDPEIHFLNNIEKNVIDQTIDIYKQSWVKYLLKVVKTNIKITNIL